MTAVIAPAALEHVEETLQIGIGVSVRTVDRVADAGLRGEMHDGGKPMLVEQRGNRGTVGKIGLHKGKAGIGTQDSEPCPFQRGIIIVVDVVEADDLSTFAKKLPGDVKADEAGCARDQNRLICHPVPKHCSWRTPSAS